MELKRMQEQYEEDEIERERAKIIAEEEAKNLQRRLKRLQDSPMRSQNPAKKLQDRTERPQ